MALHTVTLNWNSVTTGQSYTVEHKKNVDSTWTTDITNLSAITYNVVGLIANTLYDFRVTAKCSSGVSAIGVTTQITTPDDTVYIWIEDTYTCAQDEVFTEVSRVETLSSPKWSYYYAPQDRMYVMDQDDTGGVFWYFDPDTFAAPSDRIYIPGTNVISQCYMAAPDDQYKRLYATGMWGGGSTSLLGGLMVYDIVADTLNVIDYGRNNSSAFSRVTISIEGNRIYCGDRTNGTITIIARDTLTVLSTIPLISIPVGPGGRAVTGAATLTFVNGEIWVWENGDPSSVNNYILRYNTDLTTLIGFIDTSAHRTIWQDSSYWGTSYFDSAKNRFYAADTGASKIVVINTLTNAIDEVLTITNREGYKGAITTFVIDPITNDLYFSIIVGNPNGDPDTTKKSRTYKINKDNLDIEQVYPNLNFSQLTRVGDTNILYGMVPGLPRWSGGAWATDGIVIKFTR